MKVAESSMVNEIVQYISAENKSTCSGIKNYMSKL